MARKSSLERVNTELSDIQKRIGRLSPRKVKHIPAILVFALIILVFILVKTPVYADPGFYIEVFSGKDVYSVGDTAHVFVVPDNVDYSIEVYGPEDIVVAESNDFPVEIPGTYTVNALAYLNNKSYEASAMFEVVGDPEAGAGENKSDDQSDEILNLTDDITLNETIVINDSPVFNESNASNLFNISNASLENKTKIKIKEYKKAKMSWGKLKKLDINFSRDDLIDVISKGNKQVKASRDGVNLMISGIGTEDVKGMFYSDAVLHVDSMDIDEAEIILPHESLPSISRRPVLYIRADGTDNFTRAEPYVKDGQAFNLVKVTPEDYVFNVEHFSDYYVNSSGGDYGNLTECLADINNTQGDSCLINAGSYWDISRNSFNITPASDSGVITILSGNLTLNCNGSSFHGDSTAQTYAIYVVNAENINISNCTAEYYEAGIYLKYANNSNMTYNILENNLVNGIYMEYSNHNALLNNTFNSNAEGITLLYSDYNNIVNNTIYNNLDYGIHIFDGSNNDLSRNVLYSFESGYYDMRIEPASSSNNLVWMNSMYSAGIYDIGVDNDYCINNEGNFYGDNIDYSGVSAGPGIPSLDCGPAYFDEPHSGSYQDSILLNWTDQSSIFNITYHLYYSNNSGTSWNYINLTNSTSLNWSLEGISGGTEYMFKLIPYDQTYNGTSNYTDTEVRIRKNNQWVCSDMSICEYQNITDALDDINETNSTIYLVESGSEYLLSKTASYYLNVSGEYSAIYINATGITLDCNNSVLKGVGNGYAVYAGYYNNITLKNCIISNYSKGAYFISSINDTIKNTTCYNNTQGISLQNTNKSSLVNNTLFFNKLGLHVNSSCNNSLINLSFLSNKYGAQVESSCNILLADSLFYNNTEGARMLFADNNDISRNYMLNNNRGVYLSYSDLNSIENNSINRSTETGIYLFNSSFNTLSSNSIYNSSSYGIYLYTRVDSNNITENTIYSPYTFYFDITIGSGLALGNNIWLNNIYGKGIDDIGTTSFCVGNKGNFYEEGITKDHMGSDDCGPANITFPDAGGNHIKTLMITWTNQSSLYNVSYYLYYSDNNGTSWNYLNRTNETEYNWDIKYLNGSEFLVKIVPFNDYYNATNDNTSIPFSITSYDNEYVCVNSSFCEYQNITSALIGENNTNSTISLLDSNSTHVISLRGAYNISTLSSAPAISINAGNITLDCNSSVISGSGTGIGIRILSNNATIVNCTLSDYSTGILSLGNQSNITRNTLTDSSVIDLNISDYNGNVWLNSFYSHGISFEGGNTDFCIGNHGNFYADNIDVSYIGNSTGENGTYIGGDCGPANLTLPEPGETYSRVLHASWDSQSSINNISYSLYYSPDNGSSWSFIDTTSYLEYNWDISTLTGGPDHVLRLIPYDSAYNATNDYTDWNFSVNREPNITSVAVNATSILNSSEDNLTAYVNGSYDIDGHSIVVDYDWRESSISDAVISLPFLAPDNNDITYGLSSFSYNGIVNGAVFNRTAGFNSTSAFEFDGVDDNIILDNVSGMEFSSSPFSVQAWVKRKGDGTPSGSAGTYVIIAKAAANLSWDSVGFGLAQYNPLYPGKNEELYFGAGSGSSFYTAEGVMPEDGRWYHLVGVWNTTDLLLYINGTLAGTSSVSGPLNTPDLNITIGAFSVDDSTYRTSAFNGTIDDVKIWNRSLSADEVSLLYRNRTDVLHSSATVFGDNWSVVATPIDEYGLNGSGIVSNNILIKTFNKWVCSDPSICGYTNITQALLSENNSNTTLQIIGPNATYTVTGSGIYNLSPGGANPAIVLNASNITLDCNGSSISGPGLGTGILVNNDNSTVVNCTLLNYSTGIKTVFNHTNITRNSIENSMIDLNISSYFNNVWLNSFYSHGISFEGGNTDFCINNEGNFYADNIDISNMGDGTGIGYGFGNDCGPANITMPSGSNFSTAVIHINWTAQSSMNSINYYLYYSDDAGSAWNYLATTSALEYNFDTSALLSDIDYVFKVIPYDPYYNATNVSSPLFAISHGTPSLSLVNQTYALSIVNETNPVPTGKNLSIRINVSSPVLNASSALLRVWQSSKGSSVLYEGLFSLITGSLKQGIWAESLDLNTSFSTPALYNYTVFVNDTSNITAELEGNFSVVMDNWVCSNSLLCEYTDLASALSGENSTQGPLYLVESGASYSLNSSQSYNLSPGASAPAIVINSSNIVLDCGGSGISGSGTGYGIYVANDSITISDCIISNYSVGIYFDSPSDNIAANNTLSHNTQYGIYLNDNSTNITGNSFNNTGSSADLYITSSSMNNSVWLNNFYAVGINDSGQNTSFCVGSYSNYYVSGISSANSPAGVCSVLASPYLDNDNDTYYSNLDCNDNSNSIHPGAAEQCNGVDDNCNGQTDEGCASDESESGGHRTHRGVISLPSKKTYTITDTSQLVNITRGETVRLDISDKVFDFTLSKVYVDRVDAGSDLNDFELILGEENELDLDNDSIMDINMTLDIIYDGTVGIKMRSESGLGSEEGAPELNKTVNQSEELPGTGQEESAAYPEGFPEEPASPVQEQPINIASIIGFAVVLLLGIILLVMAVLSYRKQGAAVVPVDNGSEHELQVYADHMLSRGFNKDSIMKKITEAGWPDEEARKIADTSRVISGLKDDYLLARKRISAGDSRENVKKDLIKKGWKEKDAELMVE